ncbi:MAG: hypothetical protein ACTH9H_13405 [Galactobacter sp.]
MEDNPWVNLLGIIFGSTTVGVAVNSGIQKWSGRAEARRLRNREIAEAAAEQRATVDRAEAREDYERRWRQILESENAALRVQLIHAGGTPPPPPDILKLLGPRP